MRRIRVLMPVPGLAVLHLPPHSRSGDAGGVLEHELSADHGGPDYPHEARHTQDAQPHVLGGRELGAAKQLPGEHGEAIHDLMETHETLALTTMGIFTAVLAWKLFRRSKLTGAEEAGLRVLSLAGLVTIVWTGVLGGKLMFEHAAGIPNATMQREMQNREAGHHHEAGEVEEHEHAAPADTAKGAGHTHPPGTPPHKQ